jgi:hypothetical protein
MQSAVCPVCMPPVLYGALRVYITAIDETLFSTDKVILCICRVLYLIYVGLLQKKSRSCCIHPGVLYIRLCTENFLF